MCVLWNSFIFLDDSYSDCDKSGIVNISLKVPLKEHGEEPMRECC